MTRRVDQRWAPEGRHRSPWGRSGRILPIRWGRIIAIGAVLAVALGGLVLLRWGTRGATEPAVGHDGGIAGPMSITSSPNPPPSPGTVHPSRTPGPAMDAPAPPENAMEHVPAGSAVPAASQAGPMPVSSPVSSRPPLPTGSVAVPAGPVLRLSRTAVDLGEAATSDAVDLASQGSAAVRFAVGPTPAWLSVTPRDGRLDVGESVALAIRIDRTAAPVGVVQADVRVSAVNGAGGGTVRVRASVSGPPTVVSVVATPEVVYPGGCLSDVEPTVSTVRVVAEDSAGILSVGVVARMPDGRTVTKSLDLDNAHGIRSTWSTAIGPAGAAGRVSLTVTVTDLDGLKDEAEGSLTVEACRSPVPAGPSDVAGSARRAGERVSG